MFDMKFVRENPELVMDAMRKRNANVNLDEFLELEKKRRELTLQVEAHHVPALQASHNLSAPETIPDSVPPLSKVPNPNHNTVSLRHHSMSTRDYVRFLQVFAVLQEDVNLL